MLTLLFWDSNGLYMIHWVSWLQEAISSSFLMGEKAFPQNTYKHTLSIQTHKLYYNLSSLLVTLLQTLAFHMQKLKVSVQGSLLFRVFLFSILGNGSEGCSLEMNSYY